MGGNRWFPRGQLLANFDSSIPARRLVTHHRQYVDALDFWRQCRGPDGAGAIWDFLPDLWLARRADAFAHKSRLDRAVGRSIGRNRWCARRLPAVLSDGAAGRVVSDFLFPISLWAPGGALFGNFVLESVVWWDAGFG